MADLVESVVLGLYVPIIVFAGVACWMLIVRLLLPAIRERKLSVDRYAIALSAVFAMAAHLTENVYYGSARWLENFKAFDAQLPLVGAWKVLILASALMACAALSKATTDGPHLARLTGIALALWFVASAAAWILV